MREAEGWAQAVVVDEREAMMGVAGTAAVTVEAEKVAKMEVVAWAAAAAVAVMAGAARVAAGKAAEEMEAVWKVGDAMAVC